MPVCFKDVMKACPKHPLAQFVCQRALGIFPSSWARFLLDIPPVAHAAPAHGEAHAR
jgi:hypothetical protein